MKLVSIISIVLTLCCGTFSILAQSSLDYSNQASQIQVGPFITGKGCVNTVDPPQGIQNDFQLSKLPDFGIRFSYKFEGTSQTKFIADLSYLSTAMKFKLYNDPNTNWVNEFYYFNIGVGAEISWFLLSLNFGIPLSGKWGIMKNVQIDLKREEIATLIQIRVGALIPLIENTIGNFYLVIHGDYFLTGALSQDINYNPRIASLSIGLSYMFNL
ncbi:MAG: hypothetical protein N2517_08820 [Ignavibacteria bacterium]|nr:hypothetical protein [Ignavibacteria bacterium]